MGPGAALRKKNTCLVYDASTASNGPLDSWFRKPFHMANYGFRQATGVSFLRHFDLRFS